MDVSLVMFKADGTRRDFPITKSRVVLGRTNTCDLRIPLSSVSRQHCELSAESDGIHLRDMGSSNGTFHNGSRVQEAVLSPGDEITIGQIVFTVVIEGVPADVSPRSNGAAAADSAIEAQELRSALEADEDDQVEELSADEHQVLEIDELEAVELGSGDLGELGGADLEGTVLGGEDMLAAGNDDFDDDPIAALEALAQADDETDDLPLLTDDDDQVKPKK